MMEPAEAAPLIAAFVFLAGGLAVWGQEPRSVLHGLGFALGASVSFWAIVLYMLAMAPSHSEAATWARLAVFAPSLVFCAFLFVLRALARSTGESLFRWSTALPLAMGFLILLGAFHPEVIVATSLDDRGSPFTYGRLYPLEISSVLLLGFLALVQGIRTVGRLTGRNKARAEIMLIGMVLSGPLSALTNLFLPLLGYVDTYPYGPVLFAISVGATYYAIAWTRPFDVEIAVGRVVRTRRYLMHAHVREVLSKAENFLSPTVVSESLQKAFETTELNLAVLDGGLRPVHVHGNPDLPVPSPSILSHRNGRVLTRSEASGALRREMEDKGLAAVVRLGDPGRPFAALNLGEPFNEILFSSQDFALLAFLAGQLDIALRIVMEHERLVEKPVPSGVVHVPLGEAVDRLHEGSKKILVLDPGGKTAGLIRGSPVAKLIVDAVATESELLARAPRGDNDLIVLVNSPQARSLDRVVDSLRKACPDLPVVLFADAEKDDQPPETVAALPPQVLGVYPLTPWNAVHVARVIETAVAAGRYYRGDLDMDQIEKSPRVRERLFPALVAVLSEAKDFMGMTRLFQKKLILHALRHSKTGNEAARKLGISAPNLSLKLNYLKITERASG